jgi:hypothetical protein
MKPTREIRSDVASKQRVAELVVGGEAARTAERTTEIGRNSRRAGDFVVALRAGDVDAGAVADADDPRLRRQNLEDAVKCGGRRSDDQQNG